MDKKLREKIIKEYSLLKTSKKDKIYSMKIEDMKFDVTHPQEDYEDFIEAYKKGNKLNKSNQDVKSFLYHLNQMKKSRWILPVLIDDVIYPNTVLDGTHRIAAALALGRESLPTIGLSELSYEEAKKITKGSVYEEFIEEYKDKIFFK